MKQDSWLYSDSFLKRCFAIWGHYMVANLIIGLPIALLSFLLASIFASAMVRSTSWDRMQDSDDLPPELQMQLQNQMELSQ